MIPQLYPIFPEPILEVRAVGLDQDKVQNLFKKQAWADTNADDNPDNFLKISKNLKVLDDAEDIKKIFMTIVNEYARDVMRYKNKFYMTTSWFVKAEKNNISVLHNHGNSIISACYYFGLLGDKKSKIVFERPFLSQFDLKPIDYNNFNGVAHIFEIGNDAILVFPSHLKHKAMRHENSETRKSLAMNFMPEGLVGTGTTELYLSGPNL